jgi:hypothetical protein
MTFASSQEAYVALSSVKATQADLIAFVRQLSVDAPGSLTVLYSGFIGGTVEIPGSGTPAWQILKDMGKPKGSVSASFLN